MPSYSLANWDGHLSEQNQQSQDKQPTNIPLTFGSPIRLLKVSKPTHLQEDVQPNPYMDGELHNRVGADESGGGNLGVSSTARVSLFSCHLRFLLRSLLTRFNVSILQEHPLSPHLDKTSNVIERDMLYQTVTDKEFQIPIDSAKEGPKKDFQQYPESVYSADAGGKPYVEKTAVDGTMVRCVV